MKYFFTITSIDTLIIDHQQADLSDIDAACEYAIELAELVFRDGQEDSRITITDDRGEIIGLVHSVSEP